MSYTGGDEGQAAGYIFGFFVALLLLMIWSRGIYLLYKILSAYWRGDEPIDFTNIPRPPPGERINYNPPIPTPSQIASAQASQGIGSYAANYLSEYSLEKNSQPTLTNLAFATATVTAPIWVPLGGMWAMENISHTHIKYAMYSASGALFLKLLSMVASPPVPPVPPV